MANIPKLGVTGLMDSSGVMDSGDNLRPNVDLFYGPYTSLEQAFNTLKAAEMNVIGVTVGITDATGSISEYWLRDATASVADLIPKNTSIPTYQPATQSADGLCSAADKAKLDGIRSSIGYTSLTKTISLGAASFSLRGIDMWRGSVHVANIYASLEEAKNDIAEKFANNSAYKIISFKYGSESKYELGYVFQTVNPTGASYQRYFLTGNRFVVEVDAEGEIQNEFVEEPTLLAYVSASHSLFLRSNISTQSVPNNDASDYCALPMATQSVAGLVQLSKEEVIPQDQILTISTNADGKIVAENVWFENQFAAVDPNLMAKVEVSALDALRLPKTATTDYWVVNNGKVCGRLFLFDDGMTHKTTQVLITNSTIEGITSFAHQRTGIGIYYRFFGLTANDVPAGQWTSWAPLVDTTSVSIKLGTFTNVDDACALAATAPYAGNTNIAHMTFFDSSSRRLYVIEQYVIAGKCWQTLIGAGSALHRTITLANSPSPVYFAPSAVGDWALCSYYGSFGKADGSEAATAARAAAHAVTIATIKSSLSSTMKTSFSGTWENSAFFVAFPKGMFSKVEMQAVTALGTTSYSLAAGTVIRSNASTDDFDIFFVSNKAITATNTATMNVTLSN